MPKQKSLLELQLYEESDFSIIWSSDDDDDDYDDYDYDNYRYHSQQPMIVDNSLINNHSQQPLTLGERKDNEKQKSIQYQNTAIDRGNFAIIPPIKSRNKEQQYYY